MKLDVVDDYDNVVDCDEIVNIVKNSLIHRGIYVLIFNKDNDLLLRKLPLEDENHPSFWNLSVNNYPYLGEDYEDAAARLIKEEIGVDCKLDFFSKELYINNNIKKFVEIYKGIYNKDIKAEGYEFCSMKKMKRMIEKGESMHPELLMILGKYYKIG